MSRHDALRAFTQAHGWGDAAIAPLAQDASFRRYWRLTAPPGAAVLMDAPPPHETVGPYLSITALLETTGLSVPKILAADPAQGFVLLEDFGDTLFPALVTPSSTTELYDAATDALAILSRRVPPGLPNWGPAEMTAAVVKTFLDWWWPACFGAPPALPIRAAFVTAMHDMLAPLSAHRNTLVHRDYFAGNLFWLPARHGAARVGIIDFQDAALGSPAYDLVSLVQDARRDLPPDLAPRAIARLLAARPDLDRVQFEQAFAMCAAQRHLRVAALWVRLDRRDHKPAYLQHGPRCWALLDRALAHPATAPLAAFLDRHVPPALRRNPDRQAA